MSRVIRVLKLNLEGKVTWEYAGRELRRESNEIEVEAYFNRPDFAFLDIVLKQGDRFVETFYSDRWYNIFEVHDREDDRCKGWYCNICEPAVIEADSVSYVDLALDLWMGMNGQQTLLDEDEFAQLKIDQTTMKHARAAVEELITWFNTKTPHENHGG